MSGCDGWLLPTFASILTSSAAIVCARDDRRNSEKAFCKTLGPF
jgi:hypothetical protein